MHDELRAKIAEIQGRSTPSWQQPQQQGINLGGQQPQAPQYPGGQQLPPEAQVMAGLYQEFLGTETGKEILALFNSEFEGFVNSKKGNSNGS